MYLLYIPRTPVMMHTCAPSTPYLTACLAPGPDNDCHGSELCFFFSAPPARLTPATKSRPVFARPQIIPSITTVDKQSD